MKYCGKRLKKQSGGGLPDLSGAVSREWVSSLKGPSRTRKESPAPMNVCDLKIRIDRYVGIKFQGRGTQFGLHMECVFSQRPKLPSEEGKAKGIDSPMPSCQQAAADP